MLYFYFILFHYFTFNNQNNQLTSICKVLNHNPVRLKEQHEATPASKIFPVGRNLEQMPTPEGGHLLWLVGLNRKYKIEEREIVAFRVADSEYCF